MHTDKLTTKCHICLHTWKQGGLMCGIWDWQSTIVKDLNDSQDPKHTLFCREIVFVAIYALFSDNKCPLFTRLGGGFAQSGHCPLFLPFFLHDGFPKNYICFPCSLLPHLLLLAPHKVTIINLNTVRTVASAATDLCGRSCTSAHPWHLPKCWDPGWNGQEETNCGGDEHSCHAVD